jgi:hypothetical protein
VLAFFLGRGIVCGMTNEPHGFDPLGMKALGKSLQIVTQGAVDGASAFLSRICLPAAEELGLAWKDRVHDWRMANTVKIVNRSEEILNAAGGSEGMKADPRLVHKIVEEGSWNGDELVQEMWAGLLASACSEEDELNDSNLIFGNLLGALTSLEARILKLACELARDRNLIRGEVSGLTYTTGMTLNVDFDALVEAVGVNDVERLDRELDHMRTIGLIAGGFQPFGYTKPQADLAPTTMALQLYVRASGSRKSVVEFFDIKLPSPPDNPPEAVTTPPT